MGLKNNAYCQDDFKHLNIFTVLPLFAFDSILHIKWSNIIVDNQ